MIDWAWFKPVYEERKARHEAGLCVNCGERPAEHYSCHHPDCPGWPDDPIPLGERTACSYCGGKWVGPQKNRGDWAVGHPLAPSWVQCCARCTERRGRSLEPIPEPQPAGTDGPMFTPSMFR